ncbi:MAG: hypothetical protein K5888_06120 [Lachnospiraceae bacterium]|nr:hypothetical protein [Lachnospiraceae bacterium]
MISLDEIKKKADPGFKTGPGCIYMGHPLKRDLVFENFIRSYSVYYDVSRNDRDTENNKFEVTEGFDAEARFDSKSEQYFLIKAAKVADIHSAEYVYFSSLKEPTLDELKKLDEKAWECGIAHAAPGPDHKNTDAVLIVIADKLDDEVREFVKKTKHSRNYRFALHGYSNFRLVAVELNTGKAYFNRQARILMKLVGNILKEEKEISK